MTDDDIVVHCLLAQDANLAGMLRTKALKNEMESLARCLAHVAAIEITA
jgi:hypothetical protein